MKNTLTYTIRIAPALVFALLLYAVPVAAKAEIIYIGAGALSAVADTGADPTAAVPTEAIQDDILIVQAWTRNTSDTTTVSGFTEFAQVDTGTASHRWFWRRHDGDEATVTCNRTGTTGDSYCRMYAFRGVVTSGDPWNTLGTPQGYTSTTDPVTYTAITTGADDSMVVVLAAYEDNNASVGTMTGTDPAAYTEVYAESATGGVGGSVTIGYELRSAAGSTGTISYNYGTIASLAQDEGSVVLSLAPATEPTTPYYVCAGTLGAAAATGADPTATVPACSVADDILIIAAWTRSTSDTTTITDFTEFGQIDTGTGSHRWFWKRHDGSESTATCDRTGTTGDSYCRMYAFRNVIATGNPWNTLGTPEADTGTTDPTSHTAITTGAANSLVVALMGYEDNDNTTYGAVTGTDPSAYVVDHSMSATGSDGSIIMAFALRTAAGSTGTISYNYGTIASRTDDEASIVLSLASNSAAPTVTTEFASNVGSASATLHGSISATGGDNADEHGFAYSTDSGLATGVSTTTLGAYTGTGNFSGGIGSLSNDTTYYYRAYATNGNGTGYGSIRSFTTGNTTATRSMRLFGGTSVIFYTGRIQLFQQ